MASTWCSVWRAAGAWPSHSRPCSFRAYRPVPGPRGGRVTAARCRSSISTREWRSGSRPTVGSAVHTRRTAPARSCRPRINHSTAGAEETINVFTASGLSRTQERHVMNAKLSGATATADVTIHGTCDERFRAVHDVFSKHLNDGSDIGASAAVFIDGEPVVDIWGGYVDPARTQPWTRDTIVNNFSTTKTMTALCALILADRGELDLNAPVCKYWREFAAHGKDRIAVRHLLGHTAGMSGWTETMTFEDI